jgi:hypothetical protein
VALIGENPTVQGRTYRAVKYQIFVVPGYGRKAGIEIITDRKYPQQVDISR